MPVNISNYLEMIKSFLNPEKWLFEIKQGKKDPDKNEKKIK